MNYILASTFDVSHRVSGTAECGKTRIALHSDLHVGGAALAQAKTKPNQTEPKQNEENNMKNTTQNNNDTNNMSNNSKRNTSPWWLVLFLVAPLVRSAV